MRILRRWLIISMVLAPIVAWAYLVPTQAIASLPGVSCITPTVCTNDPSSSAEAVRLYDEALSFVSSSVGKLSKNPIVVFCNNEACFQSFFPSGATAKTLGKFCIVIGPRGWKPYYIRHEMIHFLQEEKLGIIGTMMAPAWFKEGMAYKLSEDPRAVLAEPWQKYRTEFENWYNGIDKNNLWEEARKL